MKHFNDPKSGFSTLPKALFFVLVTSGIIMGGNVQAQTPFHGVSIQKLCVPDMRTCVDDASCADEDLCTTETCDTTIPNTASCLIRAIHNDDLNDTLNVVGAFDTQDYGGDNVRVPAAGDLDIAEVSGNTTCVVGAFAPCTLGPDVGDGPGAVTFVSDSYTIQSDDPNPLPDQGTVTIADQCDGDADPDCTDLDNDVQIIAQTTLVSGCGPGGATDCDDQNACTTDSCDPATGLCSNVATDCDDADACTTDSCDPATGECSNLATDCDDADACTIDTCDPATGECAHEATKCDDADACTTDSCDPATGECAHAPTNCDDADACTTDSCDPATGECAHAPTNCDDADACTTDSCDPATGECSNVATDCDDADACTTDSCDPATGECAHAPTNCDDADACTTDSCDPVTGECAHAAANCDDADACTTDSCDPATGECSNVATDCDDADACTTDSCDPATGECAHEATNCDDADACTTDSCDPATGECAHEAADCDDADACTTDSCDPATGECVHEATNCDDADACTTDSCDPATGECAHSDPLSCDDQDECTDDSCDPLTGECVNEDNGTCVAEAICRAPGFWKNHSGTEKGDKSFNISQAVIDSTVSGQLFVCGTYIDNTDVGNTHSVLEAMCVKGGSRNHLVRELTATALNCAITAGGGAGDCSDVAAIADTFAVCNEACATQESGAYGDCINALNHWNDGSSGNQCNNRDLCPDFADDGELNDSALCFEPTGAAGSPKACNAALKNDVSVP